MAAYIIGRIDVTDLNRYMEYASQTVALAESYGGKFLVKGGTMTQVEGAGPERHVVIEFPDRAMAEKWYNSDDCKKILGIALESANRDIVIVDGA